MKIIKKIIVLIIILIIIGASFFLGVGYMHYRNSIADKPIAKAVEEIRDMENYTPLSMVADDFEKAIVTIEDIRFYNRYGVDLISIGRSFVNGLMKGTFNEGGSTITQQLAKNIYFSFDRSLIRKCAEIFMTNAFEDAYSKDDILELYVNYIYYGDGYNGIYEASMGYYGISPDKLSLAQSSMLAGLPQSPSVYQLSTGYEYARNRQIEVLNRMLDEDVISQSEYDLAINEDVRAKDN